MRSVNVRMGDVVFHKGDPGTVMYILAQGEVRLTKNIANPDQKGDVNIGPGEFFGELALLNHGPRSLSAIATKTSTLLEMGRDDFFHLLSTQPDIAIRIVETLAQRGTNMAAARKPSPAGAPDSEPPTAEQDSPDPVSAAAGGGVQADSDELPHNDELPDSDEPADSDDQADDAAQADSPQDPVPHPPDVSKYLFDKDVTCPACETEFPVPMVRNSRLRAKGQDAELRRTYQDIEPIWYRVWVCPVCFYASPGPQWDEVTDNHLQRIREDTPQREDRFHGMDFRRPRDLSMAIASLQAAAHCEELLRRKPLTLATTWLQLAWLYQDAGHDEVEKAYDQALKWFNAGYSEGSSKENPEAEQRLLYLLGRLHYRRNDLKSALTFYQKARQANPKHAMMVDQVQEAIGEVRAALKQAQGEATSAGEDEASA